MAAMTGAKIATRTMTPMTAREIIDALSWASRCRASRQGLRPSILRAAAASGTTGAGSATSWPVETLIRYPFTQSRAGRAWIRPGFRSRRCVARRRCSAGGDARPPPREILALLDREVAGGGVVSGIAQVRLQHGFRAHAFRGRLR